MAGIAIFGGSFDPIHCAHLALAERARGQMHLDEVLFIPARQNPHKGDQPVASDADRLRMVERAIEGRSGIRVSTVELDRRGPSYTLLTVRELREELGADVPLFLLLGSDSVRDLATWWRADELIAEVAVVPFERPGCRLEEALACIAGRFGRARAAEVRARKLEAPLMDVSSTAVRERVRAGLSIEGLVPEAVARYIAEHGLYAGTG
jgi:nicotinate-nucleotide adenylyltransferase